MSLEIGSNSFLFKVKPLQVLNLRNTEYGVHGSSVFNVYLSYACKEDILLEWVTNPDKFHLLLSSVDANLSIIADQHKIILSHFHIHRYILRN